MMGPALWTGPLSDAQILHFGIFRAAPVAELRGWEEFIHFDQSLSPLFQLIGKVLREAAPAAAGHAFTKVQRLAHGLHVQVFDTRHVIML